jgi:hypothetical protein
MPDPDLNFIARQLANLIAEQRAMRDEVRALRTIRDEVGLLREEVRIVTSEVRRLSDAITMNVMDRLQALEAGRTFED